MQKIVLIILSIIFMDVSFAQSNTKIIAHRGAWKEFNLPENSIASLQKAIELNCYGSEFDVRRTLDGVLVVCHDPTYYGDTIELKTYQQLNERKLSNGEDLPTLLDYFKKGTEGKKDTYLICEIKQGITNPVLDKLATEATMQMVKDLGIAHKVIFISFRYQILEWIKAIDQNAIVLYLENDKTLNNISTAKFNGINYHFDNYLKNNKISVEANEKGLLIGSWTVNDPTVLTNLIAQKVEFITTNYPNQFLGLIGR
jgi:glycerophosphoryl diester phosphodiesterase